MRKSAKFPREIRQVTKIFAYSLATSEKPLRRPPRTAPLSPAARCVDVASVRSSPGTATRASLRPDATGNDRRQPARAEPQRARQGVPRRRLRLRIRVYQQHGHVAHSRRRLGGGCVPASKSIPAVFFAHRVMARVWPPVARFSPRLAPRALRTRAFPTPAAPKESRVRDRNNKHASDLRIPRALRRSPPHSPAGVENEKQQTTLTIRTSRSNAT